MCYVVSRKLAMNDVWSNDIFAVFDAGLNFKNLCHSAFVAPLVPIMLAPMSWCGSHEMKEVASDEGGCFRWT